MVLFGVFLWEVKHDPQPAHVGLFIKMLGFSMLLCLTSRLSLCGCMCLQWKIDPPHIFHVTQWEKWVQGCLLRIVCNVQDGSSQSCSMEPAGQYLNPNFLALGMHTYIHTYCYMYVIQVWTQLSTMRKFLIYRNAPFHWATIFFTWKAVLPLLATVCW